VQAKVKMANPQHLAILRQGVKSWNEWRENHPEIEPDLERANLFRVNLKEANLKDANLKEANLKEAKLEGANLEKADLERANLLEANLARANLRGAKLIDTSLLGANLEKASLEMAKLEGANLSWVNLPEANLSWANLKEANLSSAKLEKAMLEGANLFRANLTGANLTGASLERASLERADLTNTKLLKVQALETDFTRAKITGACIKDWHINETTQFEGAICGYIYLDYDYQNSQAKDLQPASGNFLPGEFTKLFQKSLATMDLVFRQGINWIAFACAFNQLQLENKDCKLEITGIDKKIDGAIAINIEIPRVADKARLINGFEQIYKHLIANFDLKNPAELICKEPEINRLISLVEESHSPNYKFANSTGNQVSPKNNKRINYSQKDLATVTTIRKILSRARPTVNPAAKLAIIQEAIALIESDLPLKEQITALLATGDKERLEEAIAHPLASDLLAAIDN